MRSRRNPTILGNMLEALIGAVFLTHGFEQTRLAVVDAFDEQIAMRSPSTWITRPLCRSCLPPGSASRLPFGCETGPPHARVFTSEVLMRRGRAGPRDRDHDQGERAGRGEGGTGVL